jgi:hypothetical protein
MAVDNIARLIAAGGALATTANMSVAYASYRRKRPTVTLRKVRPRRFSDVLYFTAELKNRSEVEVRITRVHAQLFVDEWHTRSTRRGATARYKVTKPARTVFLYPGAQEEETVALEPFGHARRGWNPRSCTASIDEIQPVAARLTVHLSNGRTVTSTKVALPPGAFACACPTCEAGGRQLALFNDPPQ